MPVGRWPRRRLEWHASPRCEELESRQANQTLLLIGGLGAVAGGLALSALVASPAEGTLADPSQPAAAELSITGLPTLTFREDHGVDPFASQSAALHRFRIAAVCPDAAFAEESPPPRLLDEFFAVCNHDLPDGAPTLAGTRQPVAPAAGGESGGTGGGGPARALAPPSRAGAPAAADRSSGAALTSLASLARGADTAGFIPAGGTLRRAGPETDIFAPYQRSAPSAGAYAGSFIVQLAPGVGSEAVAAEYGASHVPAYPGFDNINLWTVPGSNPAALAAQLARDPRVVDAYPVYSPARVVYGLPNDPLLPAQWHLYNTGQAGGVPGLDSNVQAAWDMGVTGRGVTIAIVDNGTQYTHPDLAAHYDPFASYDFNGSNYSISDDTDDDPSPDPMNPDPDSNDEHGTAVAGIAAAVGDNNLGVSGVAPHANLGVIRLIADDTTDAIDVQAVSWNTLITSGPTVLFDASRIDVYNNSWGLTGDPGIRATAAPGNPPLYMQAIADSAANGRGGLGGIHLYAAGNSRANGDNTNYTDLTNSRYIITVAAAGDDGVIADYSTPGASILVSAPSRGADGDPITTTDIMGDDGYRRNDYYSSFSGTSAATPFVSGVVALMLEANPNLTWRDVQHILVQSAIAVDGPTTNTAWDANPTLLGIDPNGAGRLVSYDHGFGLVNAAGAVQLASNWQTVGPELLVDSLVLPVNLSIPTTTAGLTRTFNVAPNIRVEHVEVIFNANHNRRGDLRVALTSPDGTESVLAVNRTDLGDDYDNWVFSTTRDWDEESAGVWSLNVSDRAAGTSGNWVDWRLRIYGTDISAGDLSGPRVAGLTDLNGFVNGGNFSSFQVQFNEPVDPSTLSAADVSLVRPAGSGGMVPTATGVSPVAGTGNRVFQVALSGNLPLESRYRVDIGPDLADVAGNFLNQDGDFTNGEAGQDRYTEFFTLANPFMFSNAPADFLNIPDNGALEVPISVSLPGINIADLNVMVNLFHTGAGREIELDLSRDGGANYTLIASDPDNPPDIPNTSGMFDMMLDDQGSLFGVGVDYHYTDRYQATNNALAGFEGGPYTGDWQLRVRDTEVGTTGGFNYASLIFTPPAIADIRLDSVTYTGPNLIEVTYTITGTDAAPFTLGVLGSNNPVFDINSDAQTGSVFIDAAADLTVGAHTVTVSFGASGLYNLIVVDPQQVLPIAADYDRFNNFGVLPGVSQLTPRTQRPVGASARPIPRAVRTW